MNSYPEDDQKCPPGCYFSVGLVRSRVVFQGSLRTTPLGDHPRPCLLSPAAWVICCSCASKYQRAEGPVNGCQLVVWVTEFANNGLLISAPPSAPAEHFSCIQDSW